MQTLREQGRHPHSWTFIMPSRHNLVRVFDARKNQDAELYSATKNFLAGKINGIHQIQPLNSSLNETARLVIFTITENEDITELLIWLHCYHRTDKLHIWTFPVSSRSSETKLLKRDLDAFLESKSPLLKQRNMSALVSRQWDGVVAAAQSWANFVHLLAPLLWAKGVRAVTVRKEQYLESRTLHRAANLIPTWPCRHSEALMPVQLFLYTLSLYHYDYTLANSTFFIVPCQLSEFTNESTS